MSPLCPAAAAARPAADESSLSLEPVHWLLRKDQQRNIGAQVSDQPDSTHKSAADAQTALFV